MILAFYLAVFLYPWTAATSDVFTFYCLFYTPENPGNDVALSVNDGPGTEIVLIIQQSLNGFFFFSFYSHTHGIWKFWARVQIRAVAAGLCYSHGNTRSKLHLGPTPQLVGMPSPKHTEWGQGLNTHPHGHSVRFLTCWATMGPPGCHILPAFHRWRFRGQEIFPNWRSIESDPQSNFCDRLFSTWDPSATFVALQESPDPCVLRETWVAESTSPRVLEISLLNWLPRWGTLHVPPVNQVLFCNSPCK